MGTSMFGHLSSGHCRQIVKEEPWAIISVSQKAYRNDYLEWLK